MRATSPAASWLVLVSLLPLAACEGPRAVPGTPGPATPSAAAGRVFHVAPDGDDKADGLSEQHPWRTLDRANWEPLRPGDQLLLRGGATFTGTLTLDGKDAGDPAKPVRVGSYGGGAATIASDAHAVAVTNTSGVEVADLRLSGLPGATGTASGVAVYADAAGAHRGIALRRLDVSGFQIGISIGAAAPDRLSDVTVEESRVHDNRDAGLLSYGPDFDPAAPAYATSRLRVSAVEADHNRGNPAEHEHNSGNGIVLGSVRDGVVSASKAHDNGELCDAPEGPVGIWAYDSTKVLIEHDESWDNRTARADGGGFDLDQNVSESVLQYNESHGNAGPGLMLFSRKANGAQRNNAVRFNRSSDDAKGSTYYGGLAVIGEVRDAQVHDNVVLTDNDGKAGTAALQLSGRLPGVVLERNELHTGGDGPAVAQTDSDDPGAVLRENTYRTGGPTIALWRGRRFRSLAAWTAASGQH